MMDPSYGYYDIYMVQASFLEQIEVVEGAGSALYGSQAMTGVINMQLMSPGSDLLTDQIMGGSETAVKGDALYRNKYVVVGAAYSRSDELTDIRKYFTESTPYNQSVLAWDSASAMIGIRPLEQVTFNYMINYLKSGWGRDYYNDRTKNYDVNETAYRHYLFATYKEGNLKISPYFFYFDAECDYEYALEDKPNQLWQKNNYTTGIDFQNSHQFEHARLLYGADYMYERQNEDNETVSGSSDKGYTITTEYLDHHRHQASVFLQGEYDFDKKLFLTAGIRGAGIWVDDENQEDMYEAVPQFQALYRVNPNHSLYANVGRGF